jgi:uncharacterized protein YjiS (DUF1127 family)
MQETVMSTTEHALHSISAMRPGLSARVANVVTNAWRAFRNRRAFYRLGEMSDIQLADIGLTRSDLSVAMDLPYGYDPTAHLGAMARERVREQETLARQVH